ncbi:carbohydrate esterase family 2 protein [Plenodomus tracheiphilus IPT5]|uniref:Carbohydrate esterase family 2 protein n=1 Tax=Plenodomus tracheiphilus IPT5 TaxID=1408161 RepID=A0A6A7AY46_9PLEO|nr:carbohydrate esterase family 2 protein [Plenodomus tracheiphilus IPT5]
MKSFSPLVLFLALLEDVQAVRFLGRVNPSTRELTWPGTGVSFTFTGTSASIGLESVTGTNSVQLQVDSETSIILDVNGSSISTPKGLKPGKHTVILRKRSEALYGSIFIGNVTTDGTFGRDIIPNRKIEVIGDSITVGYGLDGTNPCSNSAALENNPKTYAALAADALGADYSIVAWSGIGLTRNYVSSTPDPSPIMPDRWTRYGAQDPKDSYTFPADRTPDVVVINLGTNDFGYQTGVRDPINPAAYTNATVAFVKTIKSHYKHAVFFLLTSPMLNDGYPSAADAQKTTQRKALGAARDLLKGTKVEVVDLPSQGSDVACDYHPNAATHKEDAGILVEAIRRVVGW